MLHELSHLSSSLVEVESIANSNYDFCTASAALLAIQNRCDLEKAPIDEKTPNDSDLPIDILSACKIKPFESIAPCTQNRSLKMQLASENLGVAWMLLSASPSFSPFIWNIAVDPQSAQVTGILRLLFQNKEPISGWNRSRLSPPSVHTLSEWKRDDWSYQTVMAASPYPTAQPFHRYPLFFSGFHDAPFGISLDVPVCQPSSAMTWQCPCLHLIIVRGIIWWLSVHFFPGVGLACSCCFFCRRVSRAWRVPGFVWSRIWSMCVCSGTSILLILGSFRMRRHLSTEILILAQTSLS